MSAPGGSEPLIARSEAHAALAAVVALARAGDDVLAVGEAPPWLAGICEITRTRPRSAPVDRVFEEIGEHTAALLTLSPEPELLEALVELGPPVVCVSAADTPAAVTITWIGPGRVEVRLGALGGARTASLARALEVLAK